jgi:murein DD-endopeptidase / murein LD-carboxypeptidase
MHKKIQSFFTILLLSVSTIGYAQIVTSKKEAVKKGIYQKPYEIKKPESDKAAKPIAANGEIKSKEAKPSKAAARPKKPSVVETEDTDLVFSPIENYLSLQMINNAMGFLGVRYHGGGTTTSGMDCSGMVTAVFNIFDIKLPRSSNEMAKVGEKLDKKDIQKGDLIFFKTNGRSIINHVGMVVEVLEDEIKFIHSSTQSGVIISSTKEPYYKRTFAQVNRVIKSTSL